MKEFVFAIHFSRCRVFSKKPQGAMPVKEELNFLDCFSLLFYVSVVFVLFCNYVATGNFKQTSDLNLGELVCVALLFFKNISVLLYKQ